MRFSFGKNWRSFLPLIDDRRIAEAERAIRETLGRDSLIGWRVLDIGSGSGLSSLAFRRLGANVVSFDLDADCVECTQTLRDRFRGDDPDWEVLRGSVLDQDFMKRLGRFDLVYAWGVLHHTGRMWDAIARASERVAPEGVLLIAIYNDQGWRSRLWNHIKRAYCSSRYKRAAIIAFFYPLFALYGVIRDVVNLRLPGEHMRRYVQQRGMSIVHDWRDWLGGYPFEVATPANIRHFLQERGFSQVREKLTRGWGCNEFVMQRKVPIHS